MPWFHCDTFYVGTFTCDDVIAYVYYPCSLVVLLLQGGAHSGPLLPTHNITRQELIRRQVTRLHHTVGGTDFALSQEEFIVVKGDLVNWCRFGNAGAVWRAT